MKMLPCDVVLDLIPLVKDGVASEISEKLVMEHLKSCTQCRSEYNPEEKVMLKIPDKKDSQILSRVKKSVWTMQAVILLIGGVLGVSFTFTQNLFLNFLVMPAIGVVGYYIFYKKWYITPLVIWLMASISLFVKGMGDGVLRETVSAVLFYGTIYGVLVIVGWAIAFLINYAIKGELNNEKK